MQWWAYWFYFRCQEADTTICLSDNCLSVLINPTVSIQCRLIVKDGNTSWIEMRWKFVHDYTARAKFCTFYIKWLEWDFYDRIAKQLFLGVNHVFSCILFPLKDIQYWLQKKSLRHIKSGYWLMEMNDNNYKWRRPQFHWTEYMQNLHKIYDLILIIFSCLQV